MIGYILPKCYGLDVSPPKLITNVIVLRGGNFRRLGHEGSPRINKALIKEASQSIQLAFPSDFCHVRTQQSKTPNLYVT